MSDDTSDDDAWPFESTSDALSLEDMRSYLSYKEGPLSGIEDLGSTWLIGDTLQISKNYAGYRAGWGGTLRAESRFRKQWFDFPDIDRRGWAIIFRVFEPTPGPGPLSEYFTGWVPPEREADADRWIDFLNSEIQERLAGRASTAKKP